MLFSLAISMCYVPDMLIADTHVHLYPCYDLRVALSAAVSNFKRLETAYGVSGCSRVLCLTERRDCHYFDRMASGELHTQLAPWSITLLAPELIVLKNETGAELYFLAGRQIVTAERLEVLALSTNVVIEDGLPTQRVIERYLEAGALPVLPWSPGKWFRRAHLVKAIISTHSPKSLCIGDTTLRPREAPLWLSPILTSAQRRGFSLLRGSDPFPFAGEEHRIGSYATFWQTSGNAETKDTVESMRATLRVPGYAWGKRSSLLEVISRLYKLRSQSRGTDPESENCATKTENWWP